MNIQVPPALQRRVRGHESNARLREAGRKLVNDAIVSVQGFPEVRVCLFDDWSANPLDSRSWQWAVAAFRFIPSLIAYHAESGDQAAIDWARRALRSWNRAVAGPLRDYEFASNDHAVANQAESLVFLLAYLDGLGIEEGFREEIAAAIHRHADLLATDDFYSRHTNHGIEQSRILAVVGDLFPGDARSADRLRIAVDRLQDELEFSFTREGVHVENSPGYHCYVCLSFLKIVDYFPREEVGELAAKVDELMPKAMRFITQVARPDGTLPVIGDTVNEPVPDYFRRYRKTRDYRRLQYASTDGLKGSRPVDTLGYYPQAGYAVVRDDWFPPGEGHRAFHLVFKCGFRSRYHRHDDDLNLVLYHGGEDWLIDSGAFGYAEQHPVRRYVRSKWGHNVPVVQVPRAKRWEWSFPPATTPLLRLPAASGESAFRGVTHSYPGCIATRDLHVRPAAREFTVVDTLVQTGKPARRHHLSLWHFPADKEVEIEGQRVVVTSTRTGNRLVIENLGRAATHVRLVDPEVDGVEGAVASRFTGKTEPARLLAFEWRANHLHAALRFRLIEGGN